MEAREHHIRWFADMMAGHDGGGALPKVILGKSHKPETNLTVGSPAVRLHNELKERGIECTAWDPHVDGEDGYAAAAAAPAVFFVGTKHTRFKDMEYPRGSVVIDPFGYVERRDGVELVRIGRQ